MSDYDEVRLLTYVTVHLFMFSLYASIISYSPLNELSRRIEFISLSDIVVS